MAETTETERAIARAERLTAELSDRASSISGEQWVRGITIDSPGGLALAVPFRARAALDAAALRHLISEARRAEARDAEACTYRQAMYRAWCAVVPPSIMCTGDPEAMAETIRDHADALHSETRLAERVRVWAPNNILDTAKAEVRAILDAPDTEAPR